eukprot:7186359-Alexandrium_andersonii.AAC.1
MRAAVSPASLQRSSSSLVVALLGPPMSAPKMWPPIQGMVRQPAAESAAWAAFARPQTWSFRSLDGVCVSSPK